MKCFKLIDHEIFTTVVLIPLIQDGLLSVTSKKCEQSTG